MPDILLIQPPIEDFYLTAKRTQPYGLAVIAASLRRCGFSVEIVDALATAKSRHIPWPGEMAYLSPYYGRSDRSPFGLFHHFRRFGYSLEHIVRRAASSGAFLIGISSLFSAYSGMALETAAAIGNACPDAWLVLGGHHPTALPEAVMAHPAVDFVVRGDGEVGLPLLAEALRDRGPLDSVPGLVRRKGDGTLKIAPPAVNTSLDTLPVPAFDLISWKYYQRSGKGSLSIAATRGCPLRCSYCAVNASTFHGYRQRRVTSVLEELDAAISLGPPGLIDFEDEHLSADKYWFMELMTGLQNRLARWRPEVRAMNGLYAPSLDADMLSEMRKAGFRAVNLALITTDSNQLKRFSRPSVTAAMDRVIAWSEALGLDCVAYVIVAGPGQDPLRSVEDLLYLARRRVLAGVSVFYPAPGSRDYRWCREKGLLPATVSRMRATALPLAHQTDRTQAVTLLRLGRLLNFMKLLLDSGQALPQPARSPHKMAAAEDRIAVGKRLLAGFFHDAGIYGVDADGRVYSHQVDISLTRRFREGLAKIALRGTRT